MTSKIYLAFRFHGNFYHSYRGDTPDELGFGKDIRIIRYLIETLDELNRRGVPVRGTWDFENYFSLEQIMPAHCPDLIAGLQRRVQERGDEMQLMSYNNGVINAHTAREFEEAIRRGMSNPQGSGLRDLFGDGVYPMVRPQEMMYTPVHLKLYKACGIQAISLYYSALPFNAFSTFIPPLDFSERYNPLILTYPGIDENMILLPCYNTGDLADHLTLRRWVKQIRRRQLDMDSPQDALLLIDMDADDEFWVGFDVPLLRGRFSTIGGLGGLVESVLDLDYVEFTTPGCYLENHPPLRNIIIGQDTADGSFDGLSSWAEKWSNQRLWTGLERARILELQTLRLLDGDIPPAIKALLDESFDARIKILSTTHFGMAAPVMNLTREGVARDLVHHAVETAAAAFNQAIRVFVPSPGAPPNAGADLRVGPNLLPPATFSLLDYARGDSTSMIQYPPRPSRALIRLPLRENTPALFTVQYGAGNALPSAIVHSAMRSELLFVDHFQPDEGKHYTIETGVSSPPPDSPVTVTDSFLQNEFLRIAFDGHGHATGLQLGGEEFVLGRFLRSGLAYADREYTVENWVLSESLSLGIVGMQRARGEITLKGGYPVRFEREIMLAAGLPYLYLSMYVSYPRTPDQGYNRGKALRLQQAWDAAWQAVTPCEISPGLAGQRNSPLRVWKHNYCDHVSSYAIDYGRFSKNDELDSANNHVTHAWVAVSDGERGLLVAQNADVASGMAFCPLRTRRQDGDLRVLLNPFGSYTGRQYRYATADTGLGNLLAVAFSASDHIQSYAPSYNGSTQEFSLLLAPYRGDAPPESIRYDAEAFAYPYLVLEDGEFIAAPAHRGWDGAGLGEVQT